MAGFTYCNINNRCALCGSAIDCRVNSEGLYFCREKGENDAGCIVGFTYVGRTQDDNWAMWLDENAPDRPRTRKPKRSRPIPGITPSDAPDPNAPRKFTMFRHTRRESSRLSGSEGEKLAASLGLPISIVSHWRMLHNDTKGNSWWVIPEHGFNDAGDLVEVSYLHRSPINGKKLNHGDPDMPLKRGLTILDNWDQGRDEPLYIVEGASDTLALHAMGLTVIGRPSSHGGAETLARFIAGCVALDDRDIIIVGENDQKPNGKWPGRDGAHAIAKKLAEQLNRPIRVAMAPEGHKDARDWFRATWKPSQNPYQLAPAFRAAVSQLVQVIRPPVREPEPQSDPETHAHTHKHGCEGCDHHDHHVDNIPLPDDALARLAKDLAKQTEARARASRVAQEIARARACHEEALRCPNCRHIVLRDRKTREPYLAAVRCEDRSCEGCRNWLIHRELANATLRFGWATGQLYELDCTDEDWPALRRQINRLEGEYLRCRDCHGNWYVVTDCRPSIPASSLAAGSTVDPVSPRDALDNLRHLLNEWDGDTRPVTTSHGWALPKPQGDSRYERIGIASSTLTRADVLEIAESVQAQPFTSGKPDGKVTRWWRFEREDGWDDGIFERLAFSLWCGEVMPELPAGFASARMAGPTKPSQADEFAVSSPPRVRATLEQDLALAP